MKTLSLILAVLAMQLGAFAQSQNEMNAQAARDADKADKELNKAYKQLMATLDDDAAKLLKASQRAWLAFRDAEGAFAEDEARGGSMAPMLLYGTVARLTRERTAMLKQRLGEDDAKEPKEERPAPKAVPVPLPDPRPTPAPNPKPIAPPTEQTSTGPTGAKSQSQAAQQFFDAYKAHDRSAAQSVATDTALKKLVWKSSAGENPTLKLMDNTHIYYEGGSIELKLQKNTAGRWFVADVTLFAD